MEQTKMTKIMRLIAAFVIAACAATAHAGLVGDSVTGVLVSTAAAPNAGVTTQFVSPATVGAGVEFSGVWSYPNFGQIWNIGVDVGADSVIVTTHNSGSAGGIGTFSGSFFRIDLGDLDMGSDITGVTQSVGPLDAMRSITFTAHQVSLEWKALGAEDGRYVFDLLTAQQTSNVPEPSSAALIALGLGGVAIWRRRAGQHRTRVRA